MIRRPPRSTPLYSSAASDVYKRQGQRHAVGVAAAAVGDVFHVGGLRGGILRESSSPSGRWGSPLLSHPCSARGCRSSSSLRRNGRATLVWCGCRSRLRAGGWQRNGAYAVIGIGATIPSSGLCRVQATARLELRDSRQPARHSLISFQGHTVPVKGDRDGTVVQRFVHAQAHARRVAGRVC